MGASITVIATVLLCTVLIGGIIANKGRRASPDATVWPAPGWYADTAERGRARWWNGREWTDRTA